MNNFELLSEITYTHVYLYYNVIILDKVIKVEILMEQALKITGVLSDPTRYYIYKYISQKT